MIFSACITSFVLITVLNVFRFQCVKACLWAVFYKYDANIIALYNSFKFESVQSMFQCPVIILRVKNNSILSVLIRPAFCLPPAQCPYYCIVM